MPRYRRLSLMEREELSRMLATGASLRTVAHQLDRWPSSLARELHRHQASRTTYRAVAAHHRAHRWARQPRKPRKLATHQALCREVFALLAQHWSPEQIARGLRARYPGDPTMQISHEAIYTYLYVLPRGALKKALIRALRQAASRPTAPRHPAPSHDAHSRLPEY